MKAMWGSLLLLASARVAEGGAGGGVPPAGHAAHFNALLFRGSARFGVGAQVVSGELVLAFDVFLDVGGELVGAEGRPVLDPHTVLEKQRHIGGDHGLFIGLAFYDDVESKGASVPQLVESQVS